MKVNDFERLQDINIPRPFKRRCDVCGEPAAELFSRVFSDGTKYICARCLEEFTIDEEAIHSAHDQTSYTNAIEAPGDWAKTHHLRACTNCKRIAWDEHHYVDNVCEDCGRPEYVVIKYDEVAEADSYACKLYFNRLFEEQPATVSIAFYKEGILLATKIASISIAPDTRVIIEKAYDGETAYDEVSILVLESLITMRPIADVVEASESFVPPAEPEETVEEPTEPTT